MEAFRSGKNAFLRNSGPKKLKSKRNGEENNTKTNRALSNHQARNNCKINICFCRIVSCVVFFRGSHGDGMRFRVSSQTDRRLSPHELHRVARDFLTFQFTSISLSISIGAEAAFVNDGASRFCSTLQPALDDSKPRVDIDRKHSQELHVELKSAAPTRKTN